MVGKQVKEYLQSIGMKQNFAAGKLGIPQSTFNSMLLEKQKMDVDTYFRICEFLGVPIDQFCPARVPCNGKAV